MNSGEDRLRVLLSIALKDLSVYVAPKTLGNGSAFHPFSRSAMSKWSNSVNPLPIRTKLSASTLQAMLIVNQSSVCVYVFPICSSPTKFTEIKKKAHSP